MAMLEAAATGQAEWLKRLLPRFVGQKEDMVFRLTDLAATYDHTGVIRVVYKWWKSSGERGAIRCARAKSIAAAKGHLETVKCLLDPYGVDTFVPHQQALKHVHSDMVEAMNAAISSGKFAIIKYLNETCKEELYQEGTNHKCSFHLTKAIECRQVDIVEYLFSNGYKATVFEFAFSAAVSYGPFEVVDLLCSKERCSPKAIHKGFVVAAKAGQLAIMKYLRTKREFDEAAAFQHAAGCGQAEVVQQLYSEGFQISSTTLEEAAMVAGGGGHLEVLKLLYGKRTISDEVAVKVFLSAAKDNRLRCSDINDQVGVIEFLNAKGCISSDVII
ncbi:hypothetical protein GN244_ATG17817 [Phytophthora infestans]|uniref:Ankyrin repeat-containing domain n=1 Tax=Phytophthora infestans TaxID=4787 RepID=A0A833W6A7_PHYIN|nr:hypothetical protein GN244_ATG17817 [Phytophthora infestans]